FPLTEFRSYSPLFRLGLQCCESSPLCRSSFPSPTMPAADCCHLFGPDYSRLSRFPPLPASSDRWQLSRGKLNLLPCTTAASTLCVLDGYGLRNQALTRPTLTPLMRFLFIGSHFCSTLPSDLASRQRPCALLSFTSIRLVRVFHPLVIEHARHTLFSIRRLRRLFTATLCQGRVAHKLTRKMCGARPVKTDSFPTPPSLLACSQRAVKHFGTEQLKRGFRD